MLKGLEHLAGIIDATINHQTLEIAYQSYWGEKRNIVVYPYYVKQYNGRWFLFGLNDEKGKIESYALDRIESYASSTKPFVENVTTDFTSYFDDVIDVSVPYGDVATEEVVLRFSPQRFPYVLSKPIHSSQRVLSEPYTVSIHVKPNRELSQQILSFIPDVEVLSPEWLRNEIRDKLKDNLQKYLSMHEDCTDNH